MLKSLRKTVLAPEADADPTRDAAAGNAYVQTALLDCPGTVARLGAFWDPPKLFGFAAKNGLKQVVADAAYSDGKKLLVPHHVLVELSEGALAHDRRTGGHMSAAMARTLAELHQAAFADNLPDGAQARYRVAAAPDLPTGTVRVRLGPAIHVAEPDDQPLWRVQISHDAKSWDTLPPITLQAEQQLFILSGNADHGSQVCPHWPFDAHVGLVMLNLPGEPQLDLSAEPLRRLDIVHNAQANWTVVRRPGAAPDEPCLYLRATRLVRAPDLGQAIPKAAPREPVPARVEPTWDGLRMPATDPCTAGTNAIDATSHADSAPTLVHTPPMVADSAPTLYAAAPVHTAGLSLRGLALQRPSLFAASGVQGLEWGVDSHGRVVQVGDPAAALAFELNAKDELRLHTQTGPRVLPVGESLPLPGVDDLVQFRALPQQLLDTCIGWLSLPPVTEVRIAFGREQVVGRQADALKILRPLAAAGHLPALPGVGGDRLGLSRQHAELRVTNEGLVVRAVGQGRVTHLDADMKFVASVTPDQPALLTDGHHLLLGHYVWRFTA